MPQVDPATVRAQIKNCETDPIYLITGDDDVEKTNLAFEFTELVPEDIRAFNVERFYGGEVSAPALVDAARTLPLMAARRIILVLRAERLLEPKRESESVERDLEILEHYIVNPEPHVTMVLVAANLDERRKLVKRLREHATVVTVGGIKEPDDAARFIRARAVAANMKIEPAAAMLLASLAGKDVARLRGDVDRVLLYALGKSKVTVADVKEVVGPATSQDDWAVTNAIEHGSADEALRELALMLDAGAFPLAILGQLGWFVRTRLAPARVPAAVEAIFKTDVGLKTSAGDPRVLLERLVVELCSPGPARPASLRGA